MHYGTTSALRVWFFFFNTLPFFHFGIKKKNKADVVP